MAIKISRNAFITALPVLVTGCATLAVSSTYPIGSATSMGPGFLPIICGALLVVLGVLVALFDKDTIIEIQGSGLLRPLVAAFAGLVVWALTAERFGVIVATVLLVFIVAFAQRRTHMLTTLVTAIVLSTLGVLVFVIGLNIRLPVFRI